MGLFGFARPAWKHSEAEVRLRAVHDGGLSPTLLVQRALQDPDARVRAAAASRLSQPEHLTRLAKEGDDAVRRIARERLSGAADTLLRSRPLAEVASVLAELADQKSLAELSVQAADRAVREAAFARLCALPEPSQALLATVAIQDADGALGSRAVDRLERRQLKDVARKAKAEPVRQAAAGRLAALEQVVDRPSPEKRRKARLAACQPLVEQAQRLAVSADWERIGGEWTALQERWAAVCAAEDDLPLDDAVRELDARVQRARRDFILRHDAWCEQLAQARSAGERLLADLASLAVAPAGATRAVLAAGWRPPAELAGQLADIASRLAGELDRLFPPAAPVEAVAAPAAFRDPGRDARLEAIAVEAEALAREGGFDAKFRFQALHKEWSRLADALPDGDALRERFPAAYAAWKAVRRERREERAAAVGERLAALTALAGEAEALAARTAALAGDAALREHLAMLKDLQARWKAVGPVPVAQVQPLRERFRSALDAAWAPLAAQREAEDWDRFANLARVDALIAEVEALAACEDWPTVAGAVKDAHKRWKSLGALPRDRAQEAWGRFKAACDAQFERCRPWFAEQDAARAGNLERKLALLTELEGLAAQGPVGLAGSPADIAARKAAAERVKAIQAEWKEVGPVPRERDDEVWSRYRALCDRFFQTRRAEFDARHAEQVDNLNRKLALIVEAEDLAAQVEAAQRGEGPARPAPEVLRQLKGLQDGWKHIGHVPRERADEMWTRWRAACDRTYATLKEHFAKLDGERQANLQAKLVLIQEAEELAAHENARWFKDDIRELQRKWRDIGHVPREQFEDTQRRFHAACDRVLQSEG